MSTQAIGIDFGTTKTLVAYLHPGEKRPETLRLGRGTDFVPTTAAIDAGGQIFFGDEAEDMLEDPSVAYLRGFKMELGSETPLYMLAKNDDSLKPLTAQELAGEFLRLIRLDVQEKVFMGGDVTEAVITCPVKFSPARCQALKDAAHAAGFTRVALTTEPEAAGQAFCLLNTAEAFRGNALVIDWGGGTLDIALVSRQGNSIIKHSELTDGDINVGGERFDERLWKHAATQLKGAHLNPVTQMPRIRKAKEQLSSRSTVTLRLSAESGACPPLEITREFFNSLIAADVDKAAAMVQSLLARVPADMKPEMLLLVGGSSAIPLIREKLEAATGLPTRRWQYSREAVALGAALKLSDEAPPSRNTTPSNTETTAWPVIPEPTTPALGTGIENNPSGNTAPASALPEDIPLPPPPPPSDAVENTVRTKRRTRKKATNSDKTGSDTLPTTSSAGTDNTPGTQVVQKPLCGCLLSALGIIGLIAWVASLDHSSAELPVGIFAGSIWMIILSIICFTGIKTNKKK